MARFDKDTSRETPTGSRKGLDEQPAVTVRYGYPPRTEVVAERLRRKIGVRRVIRADLSRREL